MKKILKIFSSFAFISLMLAACTPDSYNLGAPDLKPGDLVEGIAFSITHDSANPNIVYLTSLLGSQYTPLWIQPQGRSQDQKVTLKMPFPGTYAVQFGVETRGGVVYGDTVTFTIDNFYADFVSDPMWTNLTGGVGQSKVWIYDNGNYGLASGELVYADPSTTVEWNNFSTNWEPGPGSTSDDQIWGSTMTFSLNGGAFVSVHNTSSTGTVDESGTFMLDTENHTITFTDANLMHPQSWTDRTQNWSKNLKILTLTENQLQVAIMRDNSEGPWWLIWDFVSKDYADNYVPGNKPTPEPTLPDGWQQAISQTVVTSVKWVLSDKNPIDWCNLDGSRMNGWNTLADYPDWLGTPDPASYSGFSMTLNSADNSAVFVTPNGTTVSCTYTLDDKGIFTFSQTPPTFTVVGWASFAADPNNQLRIMSIEKNISGQVTGMWVGAYDAANVQYMAYHLIPQAGGSGGDQPQFIQFPVDNSKVLVGDFEGKGNLRIEIYNAYGDSQADPSIVPGNLVFPNKMEVTFTLSGITFNAGAAGVYNCGLEFASGDWGVQYWADANNPTPFDTQVTGNGTYTVYIDTSVANGATSTGATVFCIDVMNNIWNDIADHSAVSVNIDSIKLY